MLEVNVLLNHVKINVTKFHVHVVWRSSYQNTVGLLLKSKWEGFLWPTEIGLLDFYKPARLNVTLQECWTVQGWRFRNIGDVSSKDKAWMTFQDQADPMWQRPTRIVTSVYCSPDVGLRQRRKQPGTRWALKTGVSVQRQFGGDLPSTRCLLGDRIKDPFSQDVIVVIA